MKKYSLIYGLSFIVYVADAVFFCFGGMTMHYKTQDVFVLLMIAALIYELLYIAFLRRKEKVSLLRSIAQFFMYAFIVVGLVSVQYYAYIFFFGYEERRLISGALVKVHYGFEAWETLGYWFLFIPVISALIYIFIYFTVSHSIKKRNQ